MLSETDDAKAAVRRSTSGAPMGLPNSGKTAGNDSKYRKILRTIEREEQKSVWRRINRAIDDPFLGAVPFVQREEQGEIVDIHETQAMNTEIQEVTE
jgi:hypothetical protein